MGFWCFWLVTWSRGESESREDERNDGDDSKLQDSGSLFALPLNIVGPRASRRRFLSCEPKIMTSAAPSPPRACHSRVQHPRYERHSEGQESPALAGGGLLETPQKAQGAVLTEESILF